MPAVLAVVSFLLAPAVAQAPGKCARLADSVAASVVAAPGRAVGFARRLKRECRHDYEALYRAGRAINRSTHYEQVRDDLLLRQVAEEILNRAVQLRARNAAAWFEFGVALKKRGGLQVDAFRAINQALELAERYPEATPPRLLAEIHLQRARRLQNWVDGLRWLKDPQTLVVNTPSCAALGPFCENYVRPEAFNQRLRETLPVALDLQTQRGTLVQSYRTILRLDTTIAEAAERYGRELALGEEWEELTTMARSPAGRSQPAFFTAVAAMAEYRLGRFGSADSLFRRAIPALPLAVRWWYERPPAGLDSVADFWDRSRPLWLAPYNELQLEYWGRLTYAFLVLRDREAEVIGPETPQGDALIRYGWPGMITQVVRDRSATLSQSQLTAAEQFLNCLPADAGGDPDFCESRPAEGMAGDQGGGRFLIWTYAADRPSFIFEQRPSMRVPRFIPESRGEEHAKLLRERSPLTFESRIAPRSLALPVQIARFKGTGGGTGRTTVAFFGLAPAAEMACRASDSIAAGLFLFRDTPGFPIQIERRGRAACRGAAPLTYELDVPAGGYAYSLEAFSAAFGASATARDSFTAHGWSAESLLVSDLLIADSVEVARAPPLTWRDLTIAPSRTLEGQSGGQVWVIWEVYGVATGEVGTAQYDVAVALQDENARSLPVRLLQRLGLARGPRPPAATLQWTSERRPAPDGRALEYVALQLPDDARGAFLLVVTVIDPTGRRATASRAITISPH